MLANSVTAGILSSVARPGSELGLRSATEFLQTDASINQGKEFTLKNVAFLSVN